MLLLETSDSNQIKIKSNGLFRMAAKCWIDRRIKYNNRIKCNNTRLCQIIYKIIKLKLHY